MAERKEIRSAAKKFVSTLQKNDCDFLIVFGDAKLIESGASDKSITEKKGVIVDAIKAVAIARTSKKSDINFLN